MIRIPGFDRRMFRLLLMIAIIAAWTGCSKDELTEDDDFCEMEINQLSINQIQVIGSHNSYRIRPPEHIMQLLFGAADLLGDLFDPRTLDYTHVPLVEQFDQHQIRSIELDIYRDPFGGLFYSRKGDALVGMDPDSGEEELLQPGLKILHFPDFDYLTHHLTFKGALETVRLWSRSHPSHLPLTILVQAKEDSPANLIPGLGLTSTLPFDDQGVEEIENEILEVFSPDLEQIITPDQVRAGYSTLHEAVRADNWPLLEDSRGKLIFILMASQVVIDRYVDDHPSLSGRIMFVFTNPEADEAAFLKVDDPVANLDFIEQKVSEGFIIRTRSDADTYEARNGDYSRLMAAIRSGAQIISTDYYKYDARAMVEMGWTDYEVQFPEMELSVLNEVNGPSELIACEVTE